MAQEGAETAQDGPSTAQEASKMLPVASRTSGTGVSPETSSQHRDLGDRILRRVMLKMSVSHKTSSGNGHIEIAGLTFGTFTMGVPLETSSKKWDAQRVGLGPLFGALVDDLQDGPISETIEHTNGCQHFCLKIRVSLETSPNNCL